MTYVVDGDTISVRLDNGRSERVRLIGIDTPERGACLAGSATGLTRRLADDERVVLRGDATQDTRDRYGRLLAYAWVAGATSASSWCRQAWRASTSTTAPSSA